MLIDCMSENVFVSSYIFVLSPVKSSDRIDLHIGIHWPCFACAKFLFRTKMTFECFHFFNFFDASPTFIASQTRQLNSLLSGSACVIQWSLVITSLLRSNSFQFNDFLFFFRFYFLRFSQSVVICIVGRIRKIRMNGKFGSFVAMANLFYFVTIENWEWTQTEENNGIRAVNLTQKKSHNTKIKAKEKSSPSAACAMLWTQKHRKKENEKERKNVEQPKMKRNLIRISTASSFFNVQMHSFRSSSADDDSVLCLARFYRISVNFFVMH